MDGLGDLRAALSAAIKDITPEQLAYRKKGKWSSAEILEHLNLTYIGTAKSLSRCLASGSLRTSDGRRTGWAQRLVTLTLGYFPPGRKSPERAIPRGTPCEQVMAEIMQNLATMEEVIKECEGRFGDRPLANHPALGPLTASEWRKFHVVHGKHHARQILRRRQN